MCTQCTVFSFKVLTNNCKTDWTVSILISFERVKEVNGGNSALPYTNVFATEAKHTTLFNVVCVTKVQYGRVPDPMSTIPYSHCCPRGQSV